MNRSNPWLPSSLAAGAVLLIAGLASTGCGENADAAKSGGAATQPAREAIAVHVQAVSREPFPALVDFVGTLYGDEESLIASKVAGRILQMRVDLGDRVADGAVLLSVDPTDARLAVQQRELALQEALAKVGLTSVPDDSVDVSTIATVRRADVQAKNSKSRLDRARQLFESKPQPLISEQDYQDAQTQDAVAQQDLDVAMLEARSSIATARSTAAALALAKQALADCEIRAPLSTAQPPTTRPASPDRWAVAERRVSVGEYVAPGSIVYRLVTDQPIKLRATIPERYVTTVRAGQPCTMWIEAMATPASGTVSRVSPAVDVNSRTFAVEMQFANADRSLKPGSFGRGTITVGQRTDVTTLPAAALFSFAGLDKVFSVKDGKAVAHTVRVISKDDQHVVIEGELEGATDVIVDNLAKLANGASVKVEG